MSQAADKALWVGYGGAVLHDGTTLVPHETVAEVPYSEADASDHWQPCDENGKPLKPRRNRTAPSESSGTSEDAGSPSEQAEAA